jgi:hypothetical protein
MAEAENSTRTLACPACGGTIAMRAAGYTVTLACEYCGSLIDVANADAQIIVRYNEMQAELTIPLGTRGTLRGVEWEAIGWVARTDGWVEWEETLLFNPYAGYRWLIRQNSRWSLGTLLTVTPRRAGGDMIVDGRRFADFFQGNRARVTRVAGEFYWRVRIGEEVRAADYVRPGFMLSMEEDERERSWTVSELLEPREIRAAFDVPWPMPWLPGMTPLAHQPSPFARRIKSWLPIGIATVVALFLMAGLFGRTVERQSFALSVVPDGPQVSQTYGPIRIPFGRQAMTIETNTGDVDQGWVDIDVSLVDRATQASYDAYAINERYSGQDSDGYWAEGSRDQVLKIASLPAGTYDLVVEAQAHRWGGGSQSTPQVATEWNPETRAWELPGGTPVQLSLAVSRGARFHSNFWLAFFFVMIPPLLMLLLHIMFENARLSQKDSADPDAEDWARGFAAP